MDNKKLEDLKKEKKAELASLCKNYASCFESEAGKKVLDHLVTTFIMSNEAPLDAKNIEYEAGYRSGEAGIVKFILNQIKRAQIL